MLRAAELEYDLPPELIAVQPATPRDSARMMVVDRADPGRVDHRRVSDLPGLLRPGDVLVFNTTRVVPARFFGRRRPSGGRVEGLYLHEAPAEDGSPGSRWCVLLRGSHLRPGMEVELLDASGNATDLNLRVIGRDEPGAWMVEVVGSPLGSLDVLSLIGHPPLPPYIVKARVHAGLTAEEPVDQERYQTVYADAPGSVAAPTAGLHFTPGLLGALRERGVERTDVVLHVGAGTFKPVETEFVEDHPMHSEWCSMSAQAVSRVLAARREGRRILVVGTTAARTLESYAAIVDRGDPAPASLDTRLLISPGYRFMWVDGLLTNFHLPRSTLMAMVSALLPEPGVAQLKRLYARAITERYRFYSYGDAMLIV